MGQFGPTLLANRGLRRVTDTGVYVLGVLSSSALSLLLVHAGGTWFRRAVGEHNSTVVALVLATLLLGIDSLRVWAGRSTSLGPQRQTPYDWRLKGPLGVLGWGLDTGLPLSTARITPLPALGVVLAATGHSDPSHGLFYGLGVTLGVLAGVPALRSARRTDLWMDLIRRRRAELGPARLVLVPGGLTVAALAVAWAMPRWL